MPIYPPSHPCALFGCIHFSFPLPPFHLYSLLWPHNSHFCPCLKPFCLFIHGLYPTICLSISPFTYINLWAPPALGFLLKIPVSAVPCACRFYWKVEVQLEWIFGYVNSEQTLGIISELVGLLAVIMSRKVKNQAAAFLIHSYPGIYNCRIVKRMGENTRTCSNALNPQAIKYTHK